MHGTSRAWLRLRRSSNDCGEHAVHALGQADRVGRERAPRHVAAGDQPVWRAVVAARGRDDVVQRGANAGVGIAGRRTALPVTVTMRLMQGSPVRRPVRNRGGRRNVLAVTPIAAGSARVGTSAPVTAVINWRSAPRG